MGKLDPTVKRETMYIAGWVISLSVVMQVVFALLGFWDWTVLAGNALGDCAAVGNFLLMGVTIQNAVMMEKKDASTRMKASQKLRMLMLLGVGLLAALVDFLNLWATLIPLFFPRFAIALRPLFDKEKKEK